MWARIHLIPLLQAEADRDLVRRHWAEQAREKELMGVETKVYHSDRWVLWPLVPLLSTFLYGHRLCGSKQKGARIGQEANQVCERRFVRPTYAVTPAHTTK